MSNQQDINQLCLRAAQLLRSVPRSSRIRVVSHYDADGISAAAVLCHMLYRAGYDFHVSLMRNPFTKGFERLAHEQNELIIFSDMGSGQLDTIERLSSRVIILDHHQPLREQTRDCVVQINANMCGLDGNYDVSGATLSYLFATIVDPGNSDLAPFALAGAIGDKQYLGGIRGLNKTILDQALQDNFVREHTGIKLAGSSVADALFFSIDPYYKGLSGNKAEIDRVLDLLKIDHDARVDSLSDEDNVRLQSFLVLWLLKAGCAAEIVESVIRERYVAVKQGWELERFADLLDACGKNGYRSLGLSLCLGNSTLFADAEGVEHEYKQKILGELQQLEGGAVQEKPGLRFFYSQSSSLGGVVAGIAINYVVDGAKPLFSIARKDDELHVSCRGTQPLVQRGLDLGGAMKQIAGELDGFGGGHKIAAGATLAVDKEPVFLEKVDAILVQQLGGPL